MGPNDRDSLYRYHSLDVLAHRVTPGLSVVNEVMPDIVGEGIHVGPLRLLLILILLCCMSDQRRGSKRSTSDLLPLTPSIDTIGPQNMFWGHRNVV